MASIIRVWERVGKVRLPEQFAGIRRFASSTIHAALLMSPILSCTHHWIIGYTILKSPMSQGHTSDRNKPRCACAVLLKEGKFCSFAARTFL